MTSSAWHWEKNVIVEEELIIRGLRTGLFQSQSHDLQLQLVPTTVLRGLLVVTFCPLRWPNDTALTTADSVESERITSISVSCNGAVATCAESHCCLLIDSPMHAYTYSNETKIQNLGKYWKSLISIYFTGGLVWHCTKVQVEPHYYSFIQQLITQ